MALLGKKKIEEETVNNVTSNEPQSEVFLDLFSLSSASDKQEDIKEEKVVETNETPHKSLFKKEEKQVIKEEKTEETKLKASQILSFDLGDAVSTPKAEPVKPRRIIEDDIFQSAPVTKPSFGSLSESKEKNRNLLYELEDGAGSDWKLNPEEEKLSTSSSFKEDLPTYLKPKEKVNVTSNNRTFELGDGVTYKDMEDISKDEYMKNLNERKEDFHDKLEKLIMESLGDMRMFSTPEETEDLDTEGKITEVKPLREWKSYDIKKLRKKLHCTQKQFANILGVSNKTVEAWEGGKNEPLGSAIRLMDMLDEDPTLLDTHKIVKRN